MAGNVYSTYELAKEMAEERARELEQDIFICRTKFRSGEEFTLKTCNEMRSCNTYLHMVKLPFLHHFKTKTNAKREAEKFPQKHDIPPCAEPFIEVISGYPTILHYYIKITN